MLPVLGIFPLYYFFVKIDFWPQFDTPASLVKVKDKSFSMLLLDCLIGTWFGNKDYTSAAWTLSVELWSSFYVFILAETIVHYKFPIKILIMNNNAYGANVITQNLYFKNKYGSDNESDLSFPKTEKIAKAYGIEYMCIKKNEDLEDVFSKFLLYDGAIICEVFSSIQQRVPKLSAVKNDDGTFSSRPFEDMEPFLSREEFEKEMIVDVI
jgi:hypothetical protein